MAPAHTAVSFTPQLSQTLSLTSRDDKTLSLKSTETRTNIKPVLLLLVRPLKHQIPLSDESLPSSSRLVAAHRQSDRRSCDPELFRCMKEMNKCFCFHQSGSSTSLCRLRRTVNAPRFPSILPPPSPTPTVLICLKTSKLENSIVSLRWKFTALISPILPSVCPPRLANKPYKRGKGSSRHFTSTHFLFFFFFSKLVTVVSLPNHKQLKRKATLERT